MNRRISFIVLVLLSSMLIGVSVTPPAPVVASDNQHIPPITGWTKLAPGIWYNETERTVDSGTYAKQGVNLENVLYVFNNTIYGVRITTDYNVTTSDRTYFYRVTIVSDPDESLAQTPRKITGDEVYVDTAGLLTNGSYSAIHNRTFTWYRKTIAGWQQLTPMQITALNDSLRFQSTNMSNTIDQRRYYGWGCNYLMRNQTMYHYGSPYAFYTYHIDQVFLPYFAKNATAFEMTVMGLRHRLMGLVAYNDTNANNIMDVRYGKIGNYRGPVSLEAKYVFKVFFVNAVAKQSPVYNASTGSVDWSMSMLGVNGSLVSVKPPESNVNTTVDEVKFAFHFTRTSNVSKVKVDEHIGTFSVAGTPPVNGLSLAIAYFSFFESLTVNRYRMNMTTAAGTPVGTELNSTATTKLGITGDGVNSAEIGIGGDTYIWGKDNSTQSAYSNILSWFFFKDQFTTVGDFSVTNVAFNASIYFYEACFPQWSGYSIVHDPYFAVTTFSAQPSESGLPVLIMAGAGLGVALAALTILIIRRRKAHGTV
nr:hypothetical protein [Candidatus Njordarchaeota archaeon]